MKYSDKLKSEYEEIVSKYIELFCEKQDTEFEGWVGDIVGGIACFGDVMFFSFSDIVYDINSCQEKGLIINWIYDCCDNPNKSLNYYSYTKGLRFTDI